MNLPKRITAKKQYLAKRLFLLPSLFALMLLPSNLFSQSKVGTTAAQFLGIGIGQRANAMGGAFVALGNDVSALYWNPGAISRTGSSQIVLSHTGWLVNTNFNWVGLQINIDGGNTIGVSLTQLNYGDDEPVYTVTQPEGTGERWGAQDNCIALSYARNLTDRFSIGGSVKYISQKIWNESASAVALDVGLLYITNFHGLRIGMSISNFGTDLTLDGKDLTQPIDLDGNNFGNNPNIPSKLKTDAWPLPLFFRVGIAMDIMQSENFRATFALDALRPNDNTEVLNIGGEVSFKEIFFVRGGYKSLFRTDSEEGLALGAGVKYRLFSDTDVMIDYSYQDFGVFENVQSFSFGLTF